MYFRYEAKKKDESEWQGIFQLMPGYERRKWRFLVEPKWYTNNPYVESFAWFTGYGYLRYREQMQMSIWNAFDLEIYETRLLQKEELEYVVMQGKVQAIEIIPKGITCFYVEEPEYRMHGITVDYNKHIFNEWRLDPDEWTILIKGTRATVRIKKPDFQLPGETQYKYANNSQMLRMIKDLHEKEFIEVTNI